MSETLPCPFCGSSVVVLTSNGIGQCYVECDQCGADGPTSANQDASIEAWNTRQPPTPELIPKYEQND